MQDTELNQARLLLLGDTLSDKLQRATVDIFVALLNNIRRQILIRRLGTVERK